MSVRRERHARKGALREQRPPGAQSASARFVTLRGRRLRRSSAEHLSRDGIRINGVPAWHTQIELLRGVERALIAASQMQFVIARIMIQEIEASIRKLRDHLGRRRLYEG